MNTFSIKTADLPDGRDEHELMSALVSETEYGRQLGKSARTCQRDRQRGVAPAHVQVGRRVFYRVEAVRDWLVQRERSTAPNPGTGRWRKPQRGMGGRR